MNDLFTQLSRAVVDERASDYRRLHEDESLRVADPATLTDAAVLIAVTSRAEPGLLFVQRPDYMRSHAGQVAFPGGKMDAEDDGDPVRAALREAQEELAIPPDAVRVVGLTDRFHSGSGFNIQPVIGIVPPDLPLVPCEEEVADWFEAPLDFILHPDSFAQREAEWNGRMRQYWEAHWEDFRIWGVTASIIQNLRRRLEPTW